MQRKRWTAAEKAEALAIMAAEGLAAAAERTGIPQGTIASWGHRGGVRAPDAEQTKSAVATRVATMAQRKATLAEGLLADVERLRAELFAPVLERKVVTVRGGHADQGTVAEIVDVKHARPSPADQKRLAEAISTMIDKIQLLTGGLTAALGVVEAPAPAELTPPEERQRALAVVHELAGRVKAS